MIIVHISFGKFIAKNKKVAASFLTHHLVTVVYTM